jgi:hypothetical protein
MQAFVPAGVWAVRSRQVSGYGLWEYPIERIYRDVRGVSSGRNHQIQRIIIINRLKRKERVKKKVRKITEETNSSPGG